MDIENKWNLKTGDLLLFEGEGRNSSLIKFFTESHITHSAIVWKCPITDRLYLWEVGDVKQETLPIITRRNRPLNSARLILLSRKLKHTRFKKGYVRRLIAEKPVNFAKLDMFIARNLGKFYTTNLVSLFLQRCNPSFINLSFLHDETEFTEDHKYKEWVCSQIAVLSYYEMGIIKLLDEYTHTITPGDLFEDIVTMPGYSFTDPELLFVN